MNGIVDIFLILAGLIEFALRVVLILATIITVIGLVVLVEYMDSAKTSDLLVPYLWRIVARSRGVHV